MGWKAKTAGIGITFGLAGGCGVAVWQGIEYLHREPVGELPPESPSPDRVDKTTSFMCFEEVPDCDYSTPHMAAFESEGNRVEVDASMISQPLIDAIVDLEDERIRQHDGVDDPSIARAIWANGWHVVETLVEERRLDFDPQQGASTLAMQLVDNNFLGDPDRPWDPNSDAYWEAVDPKIAQERRGQGNNPIAYKLWEAQKALQLTKELGTEGVIVKYLNDIYFGRNAWGIYAATEAYLGKTPDNVNKLEAATLAALPKGPAAREGSLDPIRDADQMGRLQARRNEALSNMLRLGHVTHEELNGFAAQYGVERWQDIPVQAYVTPYHTFPYGERTVISDAAKAVGAEHFIMDTYSQVQEKSKYPEEVMRSGLRINTTLSFAVQAAINNTIQEAIANGTWIDDGRQIGVVVLDQNGNIKGLFGGKYDETQLNVANQPIQGGSIDKPWYYTVSFINGVITIELAEDNHTIVNESVIPEPRNIVWEGVGENGEAWPPEGGEHCNDPAGCPVSHMVKESSNPAIIELIKNNGGLDTIQQANDLVTEFEGIEDPDGIFAADLLGARRSSLLDRMTGINGLVGNQGLTTPHNSWYSINAWENGEFVDKDESPDPERQQLVDPRFAAMMTAAMRGVSIDGTAAQMMSGISQRTDVASKTGTYTNSYSAMYIAELCDHDPATNTQMNITIGAVEMYTDSFGEKSLGKTHNGGYVPAYVVAGVADQLITGDFCYIN